MDTPGHRHPPDQELLDRIKLHLESRPDVRLAILFGSAADHGLHPRSDIDLAVALTGSSPEKLDSLREELTGLLRHKVDLLELPQLHGFILREVMTKGVLLVKRDGELHELLIRRMLLEESDWLPIKRAAMKRQLEKFIHGR